MTETYDIIVVGGGHAGCEAAHAAATMGSKVLMVTMNMNTIAQMSCNPAMGGVAKGQILKEIDALGGMSAVISDKSMIQFRMLNKSKGPAMWSPRSQNDRMRFAEEWRLALERNLNVDFWQEMVTGIIVEKGKACGVETGMGLKIRGKAVILTSGTFLNGIIHIGEKQFGGGRTGEKASKGITEQLVQLGFESGRMKTGTPPRVDGRSLDWSRMEEQKGDDEPEKFSFRPETNPLTEQRSCYITYTNPEVHDILATGFDKSPMFNGRIQGIGPRYCPSIEDKINRFSERNRHQIFVEPEGWNTVEIYVNGFSTSLPEDIQMKAMRKIAGFENAKMFRPGYAIEYDYFPPTQLNHTLETQPIEQLYFAGQINGTTGYEEAACQGLLAGINAHQKIRGKDKFNLLRSEAYIGVLIDDLINKGTDEPYRMFTSRAEHRILLRQDNADLRLTRKGYELGLASEASLNQSKKKEKDINSLLNDLKQKKVEPQEVNPMLEAKGSATINVKSSVFQLIKRPQIHILDMFNIAEPLTEYLSKYENSILNSTDIQIKYQDYIDKEHKLAEKMLNLENVKLHKELDFFNMPSLSSEAREKLSKMRPDTLGQATRISGISPSDISVLMVYLGK